MTVAERTVRVTEETLADHFEGVMIPVRDWDGSTHSVPGWRCKACGWTVGTSGLPPAHTCPPMTEAENDAFVRGEPQTFPGTEWPESGRK